MSHEIESPAPPVGRPPPVDDALPFQRKLTEPPPQDAGAPSNRGHVMSAGTSHLSRLQTMAGIGESPEGDEVPPPPLTEVAPAPALKGEVGPEPSFVPRPRPSETMVGSRAPLHTAEDANTAVDISSLSDDDAERILAAAEAEGRAQPRRAPTLLAPASALPPPPPLRRSSFPPPAAPRTPAPATAIPAARPTLTSSVNALSPAPARVAGAVPSPASPAVRRSVPPPAPRATLPPLRASAPPPPPPSARASYPPPPPRPANTLLLYGGGAGRGGVPGVEELSSELLADDSSELRAQVPPDAISSSSLVEDPPSGPELDLQRAAHPQIALDPFPATPFARPVAPSPPPPALGTFGAFGTAPADGPTGTYPQPFALHGAGAPPLELEHAVDPHDREVPTQRGAITGRPVGLALPPAPTGRPITLPTERASWVLPVVMIGGAVVLALGVGVVAFAVKSIHAALAPESSEEPSRGAASSASSASGAAGAAGAAGEVPPVAVPGAAAALTGSALKPVESPCVLAGAPHIVAPRALLKTGIETTSAADRLALGVGLDEHDGFAVSLDPSTFAAIATARSHTNDTLRRVVPILAPPSDLTPFLVTSGKHALLGAAHPVPGDPPFVMGAIGSSFVWAPSRGSTTQPLWPLGSEAPIEALRAIELPNRGGYALAFRQGTSIYLGALRADKTPIGDLVRIGGLGPQLGAPAIAAGADHVLVAWADRPAASSPWGIRWITWRPGSDPGAPTAFPVPPGGGGGSVMSPGLASLAGGRFVIAWTEGAGARHVVRAEALDAREQPIGTPLTVSAEGVNAGEGAPAVTPDGRGAIVFLATPTGSTASVVAVPIVCPTGS